MSNRKIEFLAPERCCLIVVDPQERLMAAIHEVNRVVSNTVIMIHCAKAFNMPIFASTQYKKGLGPFVPEIAELLHDVPCPDKTEFNFMANTECSSLLSNLPASVDTLLLTGVETHICVYQTALGAFNAGLRPWVIADAVSSRSKENHLLGLNRYQALGIDYGPAEMAIYELLHKAGTPAFKAMLPYLK